MVKFASPQNNKIAISILLNIFKVKCNSKNYSWSSNGRELSEKFSLNLFYLQFFFNIALHYFQAIVESSRLHFVDMQSSFESARSIN